MFQLLTLQDTVILEPHELDSTFDSVHARLIVRYKNKIIPNEGECLQLKNIRIGDQIVIQGEGSLQAAVTFDCLVAKPLPGAVLSGVVHGQTQDGLVIECCSQEILVPVRELMNPSVWSSD
jgi:DNA-directed RNA polymerase subunit E'/Rpb7